VKNGSTMKSKKTTHMTDETATLMMLLLPGWHASHPREVLIKVFSALRAQTALVFARAKLFRVERRIQIVHKLAGRIARKVESTLLRSNHSSNICLWIDQNHRPKIRQKGRSASVVAYLTRNAKVARNTFFLPSEPYKRNIKTRLTWGSKISSVTFASSICQNEGFYFDFNTRSLEND
jgi:hypothetical protein